MKRQTKAQIRKAYKEFLLTKPTMQEFDRYLRTHVAQPYHIYYAVKLLK